MEVGSVQPTGAGRVREGDQRGPRVGGQRQSLTEADRIPGDLTRAVLSPPRADNPPWIGCVPVAQWEKAQEALNRSEKMGEGRKTVPKAAETQVCSEGSACYRLKFPKRV